MLKIKCLCVSISCGNDLITVVQRVFILFNSWICFLSRPKYPSSKYLDDLPFIPFIKKVTECDSVKINFVILPLQAVCVVYTTLVPVWRPVVNTLSNISYTFLRIGLLDMQSTSSKIKRQSLKSSTVNVLPTKSSSRILKRFNFLILSRTLSSPTDENKKPSFFGCFLMY